MDFLAQAHMVVKTLPPIEQNFTILQFISLSCQLFWSTLPIVQDQLCEPFHFLACFISPFFEIFQNYRMVFLAQHFVVVSDLLLKVNFRLHIVHAVDDVSKKVDEHASTMIFEISHQIMDAVIDQIQIWSFSQNFLFQSASHFLVDFVHCFQFFGCHLHCEKYFSEHQLDGFEIENVHFLNFYRFLKF